MQEIAWGDFQKVEIRVGTILEIFDFPEARVPAYKIKADFGQEIGVKISSAQITDLYSKEELVGRQIIGIVNFPLKQIGPFLSEFLVTGFADKEGQIVLAVPDKDAPNGAKLG